MIDMKTETKNLDNCQVQLTFELDADAANAAVKDVEKQFVREAQLPGFRPGKVPLALIRKNFGAMLEDKIREKLVSGNLGAALKDANLADSYVALAELKEIKHDANGATISVVVEVKPAFKVPTYKGLKMTFNDVTVKDADIQAQVDKLREACAKYEDATEGDAANEGDFVQIDYSGTIDGKSVLEFAPAAKMLAEGKGFWTQLSEGRFIPEILAALKGMKVGETKADIAVAFDKDYFEGGVRGKKGVYTVTLKGLRRRVLPDDAAFLEQLKPQFKENAESIEKLTAYIREQMQKAADKQEATRRENEATELLLKKVDFAVPASQVRQTRDYILSDIAQRAQQSGLDASYFEQNREKILKDAEDAAVRQVRLWYVIDAIAKAEKMDGTSEDVGKKVLDLVLAEAKK